MGVRPTLLGVLAAMMLAFAWTGTVRAQSAFSNVAVLVANPAGGTGTGFLVQDRDTLITNRHVIEGSNRVTVHYIEDEDIVSVPARVTHIFRAEADDLAVLKTERPVSVDRLVLVAGEAPSGADVTAVGFPGAARVFDTSRLDAVRPTITRGAVSRTVGQNIQHDASLNGGNSGGPLLDGCNQVLGVNTAVSRGAQGIGVALSSRRVIEALRSVDVHPSTSAGACVGGLFDFFWQPNAPRNLALVLVPVGLLGWWLMGRGDMLPDFAALRARLAGGAGRIEDFDATPVDDLDRDRHADHAFLDAGAASSAASGAPSVATPTRLGNSAPPAQGMLVLAAEGTTHRVPLCDFPPQGLVLGRDQRDCDVILRDTSVSRRHALVRPLARGGETVLVLEDLQSANGTHLDGDLVIDPVEIGEGDRFALGDVEVDARLEDAPSQSDADRTITDLHRLYGGEAPRDARFSNSVFFSNSGWQLSGLDEDGNVINLPLRGDPMHEVEIVIGREGTDRTVDHSSVSRRHAIVRIRPGKAPTIADLGSTNGTFVNGEPVGKTPRSLYNARTVELGDLVLELSVLAG